MDNSKRLIKPDHNPAHPCGSIFDAKRGSDFIANQQAAITDVQHLLGHASVKTTEKTYATFVKNEWFKQTIDLLDKPVVPKFKIVK